MELKEIQELINEKIEHLKHVYLTKKVANDYKGFDIDSIDKNHVHLKNGKVQLYYAMSSADIDFFDKERQEIMVEKLHDSLIEVDDFTFFNKSVKDDVTREIENIKNLKSQTGDEDILKLHDLRLAELEVIMKSDEHRINQTFLRIVTSEKDAKDVEQIVMKHYKGYNVAILSKQQMHELMYNLLNFEEIDVDISDLEPIDLYQINMEEEQTYLRTEGGQYVQLLVARNFKKKYNRAGFFKDVVFNENVYFSAINVKKVEEYVADENLSRSLDNLHKTKDETRQPSKKRKIDSDIKVMEDVVTDVYEGKEEVVLIEMYFCITADTLKELNLKRKALVKALKKQAILITSSHWEQPTFLLNILTGNIGAFGAPPVLRSLAGGYPLASSTLKQPHGGFVGWTKNKQAVIMNFIKDDTFRSWNILVFGRSRSGKSSGLKVLIELLVGFYFRFLIIDPNDEYIWLAKYFGGNVISPNDMKINVHDLMVNVSDVEQRISLLDKNINRILLFYKSYNTSLTDAELGIIKKLTFQAYENKGITRTTKEEDIHSLEMPIISDVFEEFKTYQSERNKVSVSSVELDALFNLGQMFESLTSGEEAELFNQQTSKTVNISKFTVFALKSLLNDQLLFSPYMYLVDNFTEYMVYLNHKKDYKTIKVIDEGHRLLDEKNPEIAKRVATSAKEFAKFNAGLWFITQNSADVFEVSKEITKHALAIMSNSTYLFLMAMSDEDLTLLNKKTGNRLLTETDIEYVRSAEVRETLLYVNGTIPYRFTFVPNPTSFKHFGGA